MTPSSHPLGPPCPPAPGTTSTKNASGKTHAAHSANITKPGQPWSSDASKGPPRSWAQICRRKFLKGHLHHASHPSRGCQEPPCSNASQIPLAPPQVILSNGPDLRTTKKHQINKCTQKAEPGGQCDVSITPDFLQSPPPPPGLPMPATIHL